jgi:hypothetical protein
MTALFNEKMTFGIVERDAIFRIDFLAFARAAFIYLYPKEPFCPSSLVEIVSSFDCVASFHPRSQAYLLDHLRQLLPSSCKYFVL